jgi:hypothetical protein
VQSLDDMLDMEKRLKALKNAHRASIGWVSRSELRAMSSSAEQADAVYAAIRKLLREESQDPMQATTSLSPEADAFLAESMTEYAEKQKALGDTWHFSAYEQWGYDQETGLLTLDFADGRKLLADGQILGTFRTTDCSFEWAWNNPHCEEAVARDSKLVKAIGEQLDISYLKTGMIPIPHQTMLSYIGAIALKATDSAGIFRSGEGEMQYFIAVKNMRWV